MVGRKDPLKIKLVRVYFREMKDGPQSSFGPFVGSGSRGSFLKARA
jgi:hypothetical protein